MKKKGFEVGVNFFVMLIISLAVFILSMSLAFNSFNKAAQFQKDIDQNTRREIENLIINQGQKAAIYPSQAELYSGKSEVIGLGIFNNLEDEKDFSLAVTCTKYIQPDGTEGGIGNCSMIQILFTPPSVSIKANGNFIYGISIQNKAAARGQYIINAVVTYSDNGIARQHGEVQKIYIVSK